MPGWVSRVTKALQPYGLVAAAVLGVLFVLGKVTESNLNKRIEQHNNELEMAKLTIASTSIQIAQSQIEIKALKDSAAKLAKRAKRAPKAAVIDSVQQAVIEAAPDTCAPFLKVQSAIIDSLQKDLSDMTEAFAVQGGALLNAENALIRAVDGLDRANDYIKPLKKESIWSKLKPDVIVGPFAGLCSEEGSVDPCYGVGVTLGWKVF